MNTEKIEKIIIGIEIVEKFGMQVTGERALELFKKPEPPWTKTASSIFGKTYGMGDQQSAKTLNLYNRDGRSDRHIDERIRLLLVPIRISLNMSIPKPAERGISTRSDIASCAKNRQCDGTYLFCSFRWDDEGC